jgi:glycosyltransferase involved in cell wall biosynthesis
VSGVSILVPAYNAAATIRDTLVSLQQQPALGRVEAVYLADDGSTDSTVAVARTAWTEQVAFRVLRSDHNTGQWPNVNRAIQSVRADASDWVLLLHSDDVAKPEWLEMSLAEIGRAQRDVASVCCSWDVWRGQSTEPGENDAMRGSQLIAGTNTSVGNSLLAGCWWHISGCAIRMAAFDDIGLFDPAVYYGADWDWLLRCLSLGWSVTYIPRSLIRYRIHTQSVAARSFEYDLDIRESLQLMQRYGHLLTRRQRVVFHLRRLEFVARRVARSLSQRRLSRSTHALSTGLMVLDSLTRHA